MKVPLPGIEPVAIALESIDATGDVRFSGIDLETGSRVVVSIDRTATDHVISDTHQANGLVLVLTVEAMTKRL